MRANKKNWSHCLYIFWFCLSWIIMEWHWEFRHSVWERENKGTKSRHKNQSICIAYIFIYEVLKLHSSICQRLWTKLHLNNLLFVDHGSVWKILEYGDTHILFALRTFWRIFGEFIFSHCCCVSVCVCVCVCFTLVSFTHHRNLLFVFAFEKWS